MAPCAPDGSKVPARPKKEAPAPSVGNLSPQAKPRFTENYLPTCNAPTPYIRGAPRICAEKPKPGTLRAQPQLIGYFSSVTLVAKTARSTGEPPIEFQLKFRLSRLVAGINPVSTIPSEAATALSLTEAMLLLV